MEPFDIFLFGFSVFVLCAIVAVAIAHLHSNSINSLIKEGKEKLDSCSFGSLVPHYSKIVEKLNRKGETDSLRMAKSLSGLAEATRRNGMFARAIIDNEIVENALELFEKAASIYHQRLGESEPLTVAADLKLANLLWDMKKFDRARSLLESIVARGDKETVDDANRALGEIYYKLKEHTLAVECLRDVIANQNDDYIFYTVPTWTPSEITLTWALAALGRFSEAEELLTRLIDQQKELRAAWSKDGHEGCASDHIMLLFNRGSIRLDSGDLANAQTDFADALNLELVHQPKYEKEIGISRGPDSERVFQDKMIKLVTAIADEYTSAKSYDPSFDPNAWLLSKQYQAASGPNDERLVDSLVFHGLWLHRLERIDEAEKQLRKAAAIEEANGKFDVAHNKLKDFLLVTGKADEALQIAEKLL